MGDVSKGCRGPMASGGLGRRCPLRELGKPSPLHKEKSQITGLQGYMMWAGVGAGKNLDLKKGDELHPCQGRMGASVADGTAWTKALWQQKQKGEGAKGGPHGWTGSKV